MSDTRIVIEDPDRTCLHGNQFGKCASYIDPDARIRCPGGSRRVLTGRELHEAIWDIYLEAIDDPTYPGSTKHWVEGTEW